MIGFIPPYALCIVFLFNCCQFHDYIFHKPQNCKCVQFDESMPSNNQMYLYHHLNEFPYALFNQDKNPTFRHTRTWAQISLDL